MGELENCCKRTLFDMDSCITDQDRDAFEKIATRNGTVLESFHAGRRFQLYGPEYNIQKTIHELDDYVRIAYEMRVM